MLRSGLAITATRCASAVSKRAVTATTAATATAAAAFSTSSTSARVAANSSWPLSPRTRQVSSTQLRLSFEQRRFISDDLRKRIDNDIAAADVCVFMKGTPSKPMCGFSRAVIQILAASGVTHVNAVNVLDEEANPGVREGIKEYSDWPTIPQVYLGKHRHQFVGGADILYSMYQSGELKELLQKEGILTPEESKEVDDVEKIPK